MFKTKHIRPITKKNTQSIQENNRSLKFAVVVNKVIESFINDRLVEQIIDMPNFYDHEHVFVVRCSYMTSSLSQLIYGYNGSNNNNQISSRCYIPDQ